jgi:hypothetical protein
MTLRTCLTCRQTLDGREPALPAFVSRKPVHIRWPTDFQPVDACRKPLRHNTSGREMLPVTTPVTTPEGRMHVESAEIAADDPGGVVGPAVARLRQRILEAEHKLALLNKAGIKAARLERDLATWRRTYALLCDVGRELES